ncbi:MULTISPECIES: response regulator transcription factor [Pseudoalteromonas]|jgi:two-component system response regulator CpxR|uniref:response regulator transcription factor n=1 Tax=Pseudoalteromonas TaxID=53246 RepID=UPI000785724F|nr:MULTISPECIES: response regulator transcription factor [Gammaproteobacteria]MCF7502201.1 response regulator transcription factor [Pseudoalteromonas sp. L1]RZF92408.1 response regulator transcription factor [Pseudoalteromonas sp. CO302Y]RZG09102.1 response regulator transcription factor [Pseudoalteromonas sp. CO133X]UJX26069.1 response regulator transcription factor [Pseudoalteromonas sp. CF6-2]WOC26856.1 response regulator transcription factor [Pseudoalteromonas sp. N1230-9]|tara:strand:- start:8217 stop:8906 length:690 start_codon:yes stop_codon:yes gene_type:complete
MKLLMIDDDTGLCELLSEYLTAQGFAVDCFHDGAEGLAHALNHNYELILLDVMLPSMDGFEVLKQLRQKKLTPVIMLTAKGEDFDRIFGLELGADDYIPKPFNHRELLARVKAITRRIEHINSLSQQQTSSLSVNSIHINLATREASVNENTLSLTGTEYEILAMLVQHAGEVISKEQISEQVLGRRLAPFDRSIDMHVSNIRKKIAEHVNNERIKTMRGSGYVLIQGE